MAETICWLDVVEPEDADGALAETYEKIRRADGSVHNLYKAMSLRPEPILWADGHYRAILHNPDSALPDWFLELVGTMVARLCDCHYATTHHGANLRDLVGDAAKANAMLDAAVAGMQPDGLDVKLAALVTYAHKLNQTPGDMTEQDVAAARNAGASDVEILETAQAAACFAYWARIINALGIQIGEETVGRYGGGTTAA